MSNAIQALNTDRFVQQFTEDELRVLKNTVAKGTSNEEFAYFIQVCQHTGLNPFTKQIYCTAYDGKHGRQFLIDYYYEGIKSLSRRVPGYAGMDTQVVCEKDTFKMKKNADGDWVVVEHEVTFPRGKIIGCYSIARREGYKDVVVFTDLDNVKHYMNGRNGTMWSNNLHDMIIKHTGKRSAKDQFGLDLPDDSHEMGTATAIDVTPPYDPGRVIETPKEPGAKQIQIGDDTVVDANKLLAEKQEEVTRKMVACGMDWPELEAMVQEKFKKALKALDVRELVALSKLLDAELAQIANQKRMEDEIFNTLPPELLGDGQTELDF